MKKNRIYILTILACACAVFFAGCNDTAKTEKAFYVSGNVVFPNALPSQFAEFINANSSARSASSSFRDIPNDFEFKTKATMHDEDPVTGEVYADDSVNVSLNTEDWTWAAKFSQPGKWVINISLVSKTNEDLILLDGSVTVECYKIYNFYQNISIQLYPKSISSMTSSISLDLYDSTQTAENAVSSVHCTWSSDVENFTMPEVLEDKSFDFSDKKATIAYSDVPSGFYQLFMSFKDSNGKELYSCRQIVTVYSCFVTDTWINDEQFIKDVVIDEENNIIEKRFSITDELLKTYQKTVVMEYPIVLYDLNLDHSDSLPTEFNKHTPGFFVYPDFDSINTISVEDARIGFVDMPFSRSAIDPKTQNIYRVDGYNPLDVYEYGLNYAGYKAKKIYSFEQGFEATSMCAAGGYVYLLKNTGMNDSGIIRVPYTGGEVETLKTGNQLAGIYVNQNMRIDVLDNVIYVVGNNNVGGSDAELRVSLAPIVEGTQGEHSLGTVQKFSKDDNNLGNLDMIESIFEDYYLRIADLQVRKVGDAVYLYILVNSRQLYSGSGSSCYLRGGIITVKITSTDGVYSCSIVKLDGTAPDTGSTEKDVIFGWNEGCLEVDCTDLAGEGYRQTYFYGPTKFVARKPDELVIVDEGNYYYRKDGDKDIFAMPTEEEQNDCIKANINRVVTVSLEDFAITNSIDTNFGFETYLSPVSLTHEGDNVYVSYRTYKYRNASSSFDY